MKFKDHFRTNLEDYFKLSGIRELKKLNHTPFIVFSDGEVGLCDNIIDLLKFNDDVEVLGQWKGNCRSDFFHFKVLDLKDYINKNPKESYHLA